jgi:hypothetical protein
MSNINTVKAIGAGERKLAEVADHIVGEDAGTLNKKDAATEATARVWEFVGGKDGAPAQTDKSGKNKTDFGRGFGSLVSAVKNRLTEKVDTDWLALAVQAASNAHVKGEFPIPAVVGAIIHAFESAAESEAA